MKINVQDLTGPALDWAVEVAEGMLVSERRFKPSQNWEHGGPIIERESIQMTPCEDMVSWSAGMMFRQGVEDYTGPTPLVAAMRCYVASKLGQEVEIPGELA